MHKQKEKKIFVATILILGLISVFSAAKNLYDTKISFSWPITLGEVFKSEVTVQTGSRGRGANYIGYNIELGYEYTVEGEVYESKRINFEDTVSLPSAKEANKVIDKYPVGMEVDVYYDPVNPSNAVLAPGKAGGAYVGLVFGVIMLGYGFYLYKRK